MSTGTTATTRRLLASVAAVVAVAICAGTLASLVPSTVILGICLICLFALFLAASRRTALRVISQRRVSAIQEQQDHSTARAEPLELRAARALFYVGMVTLGLSVYRVAVGLTLSEIAFILAFGLCVFAVLRGRRVAGVPVTIMVAVGVFVFGGSISSLAAQSPPSSAVQVLHALYVLLLWPWVGAMVIRTRRQLITVFGLWALSAAIDGVGALGQLAGLHLPGVAPLEGGGRFDGFTTNPNDLGGVAGIALAPSLVFATSRARMRVPVLLRWVVVAFAAVGVVLSGSIAAMGGATLALLVWLSAPANRSGSRVAVAVAAVCAVVVVVVAGSRVISPLQRVTQVTAPGYGSAQDRISDAQAAWQRIKRNPVVGAGMDTTDATVYIISRGVTVPYQVHIMPVAAWYEAGIFGLLGLLGLLAALAATSWRTVRMSRTSEDQTVSWALLGAFGAFLVEVITQPLEFQGYDWIMGVLLVVWCSVLVAREPALAFSANPLRSFAPVGSGLALRVQPAERRNAAMRSARPL